VFPKYPWHEYIKTEVVEKNLRYFSAKEEEHRTNIELAKKIRILEEKNKKLNRKFKNYYTKRKKKRRPIL